MKKWIIGIIIVVSLALGAWFVFNPSQDQKGPQQAVAKAEQRTIEVVVTAIGSIEPRDYVDVGAQVSGQLEKLYVEVGDVVEQGQLLAEIDATVLEARLDGVRAQLKYQEAQLAERRAMHDQALLALKRQQRLSQENATSEEAIEAAEAQAKAEAARVDAIKAQIEQTKSSLRADEANLNYTRIYAPMSGTIVSMEARRGQTLNAAQTTPTILTIANLSVMRVQAQVSEADISRLKQGTSVYFTTMGGQGERWHSVLDLIEPTPKVENNVVLYNALFDVDNTERKLLPKMTTQVFFVIEQAQDVIAVPAGAVSPRGANKGEIKVKRANGTIDNVFVETGLTDRVHTEIKSGLAEGDEVLLSAPAGQPQRPPMR